MASTYLSRTPSSTGNRKTWTFSTWLKISNSSISNQQGLFDVYTNASNYFNIVINDGGNQILVLEDVGGVTNWEMKSAASLRDCNGFYHLVVKFDTTQATNTDRLKCYINNVEMETTGTLNYPAQDFQSIVNNNVTYILGKRTGQSNFDGVLSHTHFIDGTAYEPTAFGEYDANGVWTIKTSPSVTYGTNGFFILKDGNSVTDQSGNGNNWTVSGGTLTNTEDSPSNVFCTLNALGSFRLGGGSLRVPTFSNGNNTVVIGASGYVERAPGTLAFSSGKYYWEVKAVSNIDGNGYPLIGIVSVDANGNNQNGDSGYPSMLYMYDGGKAYNSITSVSYGNSYSNGDIIGVAVDLDNNAIWFSKNGTWQNSATQSEIENGTTTNAAFSGTSSSDGFPSTSSFYQPLIIGGASAAATLQANFGNGYFGTTAVSSAGTNASGHGIFEYDVPSGYTALCTKGLNGE